MTCLEWIEDEVELAIKIFSEKQRYVRIPERESQEVYALMKKFTEGIDELMPHDELSAALNSPNSLSRFKRRLLIIPRTEKMVCAECRRNEKDNNRMA